MTLLKVPGVNRVTAKGHVYYYHRATGTRLHATPSNPRAFAAEVDALNAGAPIVERGNRKATVPGSLGRLIALYRASPEFQTSIKPATRKSYKRVFDAVQKLDELDLDELTQPYLLALRDRLARASGRWLANYAMTVLSIVFKWGMPRGYVDANPAIGLPKIRRPKGSGVANKAWQPVEVEAALKAAKDAGHLGLRKAIALAYYGGLSKADVVDVPETARHAGELELPRHKTDVPLTIFESRRLKVILDEKYPNAKEPAAAKIVRRADGAPYTADGLDTLFHRLKVDLVEQKKIRDGLTFHGLRKSLGKRAADAGHGELAIAAAMGHANPASSRTYTQEAERRRGAKRVFKSLERKR